MRADHVAGRRLRAMRTGLRKLSLVQIRYLAPVGFRTSQPTVARVYRELEQQFGVLAPPIALHATAPDLLAASWIMLRESLLVPGRVGRPLKEAVAVEVSVANACPYCVTMHSAMLTSLLPGPGPGPGPGPEPEPEPEPPGAASPEPDWQVRAAGDWARANAVRRTRPSGPSPFSVTPEEAAELVAVAVLMQYLNRLVNVFLGGVPLPPRAPHRALRVVTPVLTWLQRSAQAGPAEPGTSLDLLAADDAGPSPAWAQGNAVIAAAFRRVVGAAEQAADRSVPAAVRELLSDRLASWDGAPAGLSRSWVDEAVSPLPAADRAAGRLALLVAFASYQIDSAVIDDFRSANPDDVRLIELVAWAALSAALEIGAWMWSDGLSGSTRDV